VISDNGRGFDEKKERIGIRNMMSRTKECHGEFQIKSKGRRYNYYHSNRTKTNTYIEMTIEFPQNC
jgi:signal transduction histidine kinase